MSEGFNAADRKDVRAAEKAARLAEREREDVVRSLCNTNAGRRYVWDKLSLAGIFVALPPNDALQMAFNEGIRAGGLALLDDLIRACPEQFIRMMQESNERNLTRTSTPREQRSGEESRRESEGSDSVDWTGDYHDSGNGHDNEVRSGDNFEG